jgi:hypothetical protein
MPDTYVISSFRIAGKLKKRMYAAMASDESLRHVAKPRLPFLRRAIENECARLERENGKAK